MTRILGVATLASLLVSGGASAQTMAPAASKTRAHVEALAAPGMEGRLAGSDGERRAAEYLVRELRRIGARPLPGQADFSHAFSFTAGARDGGSAITVSPDAGPARAFTTRAAVQALSFSDNAEVSGEVVFAGYGLVVPESQNFGYDSYQGLDVTDKIVVVFRYFPEDADQQTRAALARYSDLRYKAQAARQRGARALVVITGPRSPNAGEVVPMTFDTALAGSGLVAASARGEVAGHLRGPAGSRPRVGPEGVRQRQPARRRVRGSGPHPHGEGGRGARATDRPQRPRLPAGDDARRRGAEALGGDWRPLRSPRSRHDRRLAGRQGSGRTGPPRRRRQRVGHVRRAGDRRGARLTAAPAASADRLLVGRGLGLIGSNAFVTDAVVPADQLAAYLNFDMVGRSTDNKLTVQATGTSTLWPRVLEQANIRAGFDLVLQPDPYQPTDVSTFNQAGVASLAFFTGAHVDYHKPSDTAEKINYEDLDRIADFAADITRRLLALDEAPLFTKVEQQTTGGGRAGLRIFTGTIPDYATDVKGLLLGGVVGGGPAEQAGLQKGDVTVETAGQTMPTSTTTPSRSNC